MDLSTLFLLSSGADASASGSEAAAASGPMAMLITFLPIVLMVVIFYFMLIRPQKKREKQVQKMRSSLEVGDEVVTAGGIIGRVVIIKDDTIVIETGNDRSKIRVARWAIQQNNTIHDDTPQQLFGGEVQPLLGNLRGKLCRWRLRSPG